MKYKDNKERYTCARTGDPGKAAPYDPEPADLTKCDKPYRWANAICDNKDNFQTGTYGVGSFVGTGNFTSCKVCGTDTNICNWEFWITSRYAGDNYKIYFQTFEDDNMIFLPRASPIYTAEKHIHIERDRMCRNGGIIGMDANSWDTKIYISKFYNSSTGQWIRVDTINNENRIHIFDRDRTYEMTHDIAYALITNEDYVPPQDNRHYVEITLKDSPGGNNYTLQFSYDASEMEESSPYLWSFSSGKSAGVCVDDNLFYIADTSDLSQPFSDAFVSFHISADGVDGSSVVPYLPEEWFNLNVENNYIRFSHIWFKNLIPSSGNPPLAEKHNYYHIIGGSKNVLGSGTVNGFSYDEYDCAYILIKSIEDTIASYCLNFPPCNGNEGANHIRSTTSHEVAHQFNVNSGGSCTGGHCTNNAWCGGAGGSCRSSCGGGTDEWCLMHEAGGFEQTVCQRADGIDKMDCRDLSANSGCPEPDCSGTDQISIRTDYAPE